MPEPRRSLGRTSGDGPAPPGVVRRRTPTPGRDERRGRRPEPGIGGDEIAAASALAGEVAPDERADDGVGVAERRAARDQPLGEIGRRRSSRQSAAAGIRSGTNVAVAIIPAIAPSASDTWSTESNSGSLSSCRSRL